MLNMREVTCFHSNLTVKTYLKLMFFLVGYNFQYNFFVEAHPLYTKICSPRIWTNLKNDPGNVKKRGIPRNSYMSVACKMFTNIPQNYYVKLSTLEFEYLRLERSATVCFGCRSRRNCLIATGVVLLIPQRGLCRLL